MIPRIEILPPAQKALWPLLSEIPKSFILYGGTAVALQLGHRESVDFDFFSDENLDRDDLLQKVSFLHHCVMVQPSINTLNCIYSHEKGNVKIQFLAGLGERQKRIETPLVADDNQLQIASLRDLLATKLNTIQMRAELKDYVDIDAMLEHGLTLTEGLACARAVYGLSFDPGTSLRALCSFREGDLMELDKGVQERLVHWARAVDEIPEIKPIN